VRIVITICTTVFQGSLIITLIFFLTTDYKTHTDYTDHTDFLFYEHEYTFFEHGSRGSHGCVFSLADITESAEILLNTDFTILLFLNTDFTDLTDVFLVSRKAQKFLTTTIIYA
jgi:hypothetical protein